MKKLVRSLLGAAILATASNAMALDTTLPYTVAIATGADVPTFSGSAFFDFDSQYYNLGPIAATTPVSAMVPGSCVYSLQWFDQALAQTGPFGALPLSAQAWVAEQMTHGNGNCLVDAMLPVPSFLTLASGAAYPSSTGVDQFGQIEPILALSLGEPPGANVLTGVIQFASILPNASVFGITFTG